MVFALGEPIAGQIRLCRFGRNADDWGRVVVAQFFQRVENMPGSRNIRLSLIAACLLAAGCMMPNTDKSITSPTIIPMTAKPRSCEELRQTLLKIAPVGTPAATVTSWLESEGFACQRTGAAGQTIYATRTDQSSYWSSQRWMVVCTLDQDKVVEFTVTQGK